MDQYVALDVSLKETSVCVLDANGVVAFEGRIPSEPASLVQLIRSIGLETGRPRSGSGTLSKRKACRSCAWTPDMLMPPFRFDRSSPAQRRARFGRDGAHGLV